MADINIAITNGTMSDDAAVAELFRRQKQFAADDDLTHEARLRGQAIFNTALFTSTPAAIKDASPVVLILRQTIESIGALYVEVEKRKAVVCEAEASSDEHEPATLEDRIGASPEIVREISIAGSAEEDESEDDTSNERIAAALAARRKRRLATHGSRRRMSAAAGVVKALRRGARDHQLSFTGANPTLNNVMARQMTPSRSSQPVSTHNIKQAHFSLIVKLKIPASYFEDGSVQMEDPKAPKVKSTRRPRGIKFKSEEFVASDADDNEEEKHEEPAMRRSPRSTKTSTTKSIMTTDIDETGAAENMDDEMQDAEGPPLRATRTQRGKNSSRTAPTHVAKLAGTHDTPRILEPTQLPIHLINPCPAKLHLPPASSSSSALSLSGSISRSSASPPLSTPPTIRSPAEPLPPQFTYTFPRFPSLEPRKRAPFHLGVTIALENIREDYELNPTFTLIDLIDELDDNKPIVDDWERKTVLEGGGWVCGVLRKYAKALRKGKGKDGAAVDVLEVVGALEESIGVEEGWKA